MTTQSDYIDATAQHPCPICGAKKWCCTTANGDLALCKREATGAFKTRTSTDGVPYFLHRLNGQVPSHHPPAQQAPKQPAIERAEPDVLDRVYNALLKLLPLTDAHRENLKKRGLTDEQIDERVYATLPKGNRIGIAKKVREQFGEAVLSVPGFAIKPNKNGHPQLTISGWPGLLIPVRDVVGRIIALKVRSDSVEKDQRYSSISSKKYGGPSPGTPVHTPLDVQGPCQIVRLTEGELKSDVATVLDDIPTISVPGAANWRPSIDVLKSLQAKTVRIAYDADAPENDDVSRALVGCARGLKEEGFEISYERWDLKTAKGIDDLLLAGGKPELLVGDAAMEAIAELAGDDKPYDGDEVLKTLSAVLENDGAEGPFRDENKKLLDNLAQLYVTDAPRYGIALTRLAEAKVRMKHFHKVINPLIIVKRQQQPARLARGEDGGFFHSNGCMCRKKMGVDDPVIIPLCNFTAQISDVTVLDDGVERRIVLGVTGKLANGTELPRVEIEAEQFNRLEWILPGWGPRSIVWPGEVRALPAAIQALSKKQTTRTVFAHTGWTRIGNHDCYLHAGGAIGAKKSEQIAVKLPDTLAKFELPDPVVGEKQNEAIAASLRMMDLAPDKITIPLLALVFRSVLRTSDFGAHLAGPTGAYKSELAGLVQRHFGTGLDARNLPGSWSSTVNSLERNLFFAKDALFTIDDFAPGGTISDVARLHRDADRLFRAQGNSAGRLRMRRDGRLEPPKPPRGMILSTGECSPRGQSILARLLVIEVGPKDVDIERLTDCQRDAVNGMYSQTMSCFIEWLAPQYQKIKEIHTERVAKIRDQLMRSDQHARVPSIVGELVFATRLFLRFARKVGAITEAEEEQLRERSWNGLIEAGNAQTSQQASFEPTEAFLRLLSSVISSGRAHIAGPDGNEPSDVPNTWGWRLATIGMGNFMRQEWQSRGKCIGWVDEDGIYLDPGSTFAETQKLANEQGHAIGITSQTLWRRLREKNLLVAVDTRRQRMTVRRKLDGSTRTVLHLRADALSPDGDSSEQQGDTQAVDGMDGMDGCDSQDSDSGDQPEDDGIF